MNSRSAIASSQGFEISKGRLSVATVLRIERLIGGDAVAEEGVLRFIAGRYGAKSLLYLTRRVAAEILKRPGDFLAAARQYSEPELPF